MQTAMPLLALRLGASAMLLGTIGWVAQAFRLPICFTSGRLSERIGRAKIAVPAACVIGLATLGMAQAQSNLEIIILNTIALMAIGAFYPPLQAMVGDVSRRGELTKNLGSFNIGWCIGGAMAAISARWLVRIGLPITFYVAAVGFGLTAVLVIAWRKTSPARIKHEDQAVVGASSDPKHMLLIARMGHFTGFFGISLIRILFPKLGLSLGWSESSIAGAVAWSLVGQSAGMLATNASPWWRGRIWPQVIAQAVMVASGLLIWRASSAVLIGFAFFCAGCALSVVYTAALYHGLSDRKARGKNTGMHESLVAAGSISGCLLGGIVAQSISLRAPYVLFACLAMGCMVATGALSRQARQAHSTPIR